MDTNRMTHLKSICRATHYEDIGVKRYFAPMIHGLLRISCSRKHETHGLLTLVSYADFSVGGQGAPDRVVPCPPTLV